MICVPSIRVDIAVQYAHSEISYLAISTLLNRQKPASAASVQLIARICAAHWPASAPSNDASAHPNAASAHRNATKCVAPSPHLRFAMPASALLIGQHLHNCNHSVVPYSKTVCTRSLFRSSICLILYLSALLSLHKWHLYLSLE